MSALVTPLVQLGQCGCPCAAEQGALLFRSFRSSSTWHLLKRRGQGLVLVPSTDQAHYMLHHRASTLLPTGGPRPSRGARGVGSFSRYFSVGERERDSEGDLVGKLFSAPALSALRNRLRNARSESDLFICSKGIPKAVYICKNIKIIIQSVTNPNENPLIKGPSAED